MSTKLVLAVSVVCAAGGFLAGRHLAPAPVDRGAGRDEAVERPHGMTAGLGTERAMYENAMRELAAARAKNAKLSQELVRLERQREPAEPGATAQPAPPAAAAARPHFAYPSVGEALDGRDWPKFGEAITHLLPLIVDLKRALLDEAPMPENVGDIQRWNGELVNLAVSLDRTDLTGTGTNGAFTHPAVVVNLVHAALVQAGKPLSERQEDRLRAVGDRYVADEARRAQGYGPDAFQLEQTIEETALKDRFYADVDALLTPEQRDVLHPPEIRGRLGVDLFSSGVIWYVVSKAVPFTGRADLAAGLVRQVQDVAGYEEQYRSLVEDAAREWANGFAAEYLASTDDPLIRVSNRMNGGMVAGWTTIAQAHTAARHQLAFNRQLADRLPPDSQLAKLLRESPRVLIPLKTPAEGSSER